MYPFRSTDELHGIVVVLLHTCGDGEHVRVEDDVERIHPHLVNEDVISTARYLNTSLVGGSLTDLVEAHHHDCRTISHHVLGMGDEYLLAFLERDGVDDALALAALQTCRDDIPLRGVDHDRHLGDVWLRRYHIEEVDHLLLGIQESVVHVDIDDSGTISHLFAGDVQCLLITFLIDESQELSTTSHVASLAYIDEA